MEISKYLIPEPHTPFPQPTLEAHRCTFLFVSVRIIVKGICCLKKHVEMGLCVDWLSVSFICLTSTIWEVCMHYLCKGDEIQG